MKLHLKKIMLVVILIVIASRLAQLRKHMGKQHQPRTYMDCMKRAILGLGVMARGMSVATMLLSLIRRVVVALVYQEALCSKFVNKKLLAAPAPPRMPEDGEMSSSGGTCVSSVSMVGLGPCTTLVLMTLSMFEIFRVKVEARDTASKRVRGVAAKTTSQAEAFAHHR